MRELIIVRHAEAITTQPDFDRSLSEAGIQQAYQTAQQLKHYQVQPEYIIASPAVRTYSTAQLLAAEFSLSTECIQTLANLYHATETVWVNVLRELPAQLATLLIVGHNPAVSQLVCYLTDQDVVPLAPASFYCLSLDIDDWAALTRGMATVKLSSFVNQHENNRISE